jgi:hypothetical protein
MRTSADPCSWTLQLDLAGAPGGETDDRRRNPSNKGLSKPGSVD